MAVTAAIEFALDTLRGAGVVITELDRDTDWGGCIGPEEGVNERAVAAELARETEGKEGGLGERVAAEDVNERTVAAELARETEGEASGSWLLEVEALDKGGGN
jgi:hypothetical protein